MIPLYLLFCGCISNNNRRIYPANLYAHSSNTNDGKIHSTELYSPSYEYTQSKTLEITENADIENKENTGSTSNAESTESTKESAESTKESTESTKESVESAESTEESAESTESTSNADTDTESVENAENSEECYTDTFEEYSE